MTDDTRCAACDHRECDHAIGEARHREGETPCHYQHCSCIEFVGEPHNGCPHDEDTGDPCRICNAVETAREAQRRETLTDIREFIDGVLDDANLRACLRGHLDALDTKTEGTDGNGKDATDNART